MNRIFFLPFLLLALIPYGFYFLNYPYTPMRDWGYFNSLSLIIQQYLQSGAIPLLDPWVCGGNDILANPQNWVYSPLVFFYLLFPPYIANILSLIACAGVGFYGMVKLTENMEDRYSRYVICGLFLLSPFFTLHFVEGHIPFRTFYLLPLVLYHAWRIESVRSNWALALILSLMFLDGGIYPFYFSLLLILINVDFRKLKNLFQDKKLLKIRVFILAATAMLVGAKAISVLSVHHSRKPENELTQYSLGNLLEAFYQIKQSNFQKLEGLQYFGHEYYHYIGISITILLVIAFTKARVHKKLLGQIGFFAWLSLGFGGFFNPWTLIKMIPMINHIHVQSRFLIVVYLLVLILIARVSININLRRVLLTTAAIELLIAAFYVNTSGFEHRTDSRDITLRPIDPVSNYEVYIAKPLVYASGKISHNCYEPASNKVAPPMQLFMGTETDGLKAVFDMSKVRISTANRNEKFIFNFNWNGGWGCENCNAYENNGLVEIDPLGNSEVQLDYNPYHLHFSLFLLFIGVVLMAVLYARIKNEL